MKKTEWHWENIQLVAEKGKRFEADYIDDSTFPLDRFFRRIRHMRYMEILKTIGKYHIKIPRYTRLKIRRK